MKNVLILGSGAREHAIAESFSKSSSVSQVFVMPGNDGIKKNFKTVSQRSFEGIRDFVYEHEIDMVFVGGEQLLSEGIVDFLQVHEIKCIGPTKAAAQIESSKVFAKNLMLKYGIPTADYGVFDDYEEALDFIKAKEYPLVFKADGLAAGKGVLIADNSKDAEEYIKEMMIEKKFGNAGTQIVIESFLQGEEASVFAFCDGENFVSTIFSQDHKRAFDGDKGLNTGGMGAFAPVDKFSALKDKVDEIIFKPVLDAMKKESCTFSGVLYAGLMINGDDISVVEFNCRFGDPETQVILPLLKNDFYDICHAITEEKIIDINLEWDDKYAVTVVLASKGYPESFKKGSQIYIDPTIEMNNNISLYFAGVEESKELNSLVNSGGRVISITGKGNSLVEAINHTYENIKYIKSDNLRYRNDIGQKGLK